jgi:succinate-semialdehyde dehydrogenase / glutarate-semialdehyde dehydrogenase
MSTHYLVCHVMTHQQIFGPIAAVMKFDTEAEALEVANACAGGLAGYVYTSSMGRMFRMAEGLEVGMVGVNESAISKEVRKTCKLTIFVI